MSDRGRRSSRYDDRDYYDDYDHRPRRRSLGRQALDKLEEAIGTLNLNRSRSSSRSSRSSSSSSGGGGGRRRGRRPLSPDHYSSSRRHRSPSPDYYAPSRRYNSPGHPPYRHRSRDVDYYDDDPYYPPPPSSGYYAGHPNHRRYHSSSPRRPARRRSRRGSTASVSTARRTRRGSSSNREWLEKGVKAAVKAGATEAFRLRNEPGPWRGEKGGRVATAAISAGVIGAALDARKDEGEESRIGSVGSALGGLVVNRLVHGPRSDVGR